MNGYMNEWIHEWMDGCMKLDEQVIADRMNEWMLSKLVRHAKRGQDSNYSR